MMDGLKRLRQALLRRLVRRGALPQDAEDAIHDAFVRLCLAQEKQIVRNPAAFLTDVVMKVRIEKWRSAQRYHRLFVDEPVEELDVVDLSPRPDEYLQADQRLERMWHRLGELSPRTREVFFLHRLQGLSYAQIATSMGVSVSAIEKHIARAALLISDEVHGE
jgi:RNA polymerase sigma factor (sigma-70 family)